MIIKKKKKSTWKFLDDNSNYGMDSLLMPHNNSSIYPCSVTISQQLQAMLQKCPFIAMRPG